MKKYICQVVAAMDGFALLKTLDGKYLRVFKDHNVKAGQFISVYVCESMKVSGATGELFTPPNETKQVEVGMIRRINEDEHKYLDETFDM